MMQVAQLEELAKRLHSLKSRLQEHPGSREQLLNEGSELVQAAEECDFMLPTPLTLGSLSDTVDKKLENVAVLTERARKHESLPEDAQVAAEQEYTMSDEDYAMNNSQQDVDSRSNRSERHGLQ